MPEDIDYSSPLPPPERRKDRDSFALSFPITSALTILTYFIISITIHHRHKKSFLPSSHISLSLISLFLPLLLSPLSLLYYKTMNILRNHLLRAYIITCGTLFLILVLSQFLINFISGIAAVVLLLLFVLWIWCLKKDFKFAALTIKASLEIIETNKVGIVRPGLLFLLLFYFLLFLLESSLLLTIDTLAHPSLVSVGSVTEGERSTLYVMCAFSFVSLFYLAITIQNIFYTYGAAVFHFYSSGSKDIAEDARAVSNRSSLGTVCLGSLFLWLISLLSFSGAGEGDGLLALVCGCLCACAKEAAAFLSHTVLIYAALYGKGFCRSGRIGYESFRTYGFERYFNFRIVEDLLVAFNLILSGSLGVLLWGGGFWLFSGWREQYDVLVGITVSVLFVVKLYHFIGAINSAIAGASNCQLSVYVEDPERFRNCVDYYEKFEGIFIE